MASPLGRHSQPGGFAKVGSASAFFPPEVRAQVTALACSQPADVDVPIARWSCLELAAKLAMMGLVASIATSTVWRWLQAERLRPWRYHFWQKISNPASFSCACPTDAGVV